MAVTQIADIIVPEIFGPYVQQLTEEKSRLIQSGALVRDAALDQFLAGGGRTFNAPSFRDLANDADNVGSDNDAVNAVPVKTQTSLEIAVRKERNQVWSSMDLAADLAGVDPMESIGSRVADYWQRRIQACFVAVVQGIFADNAAAPTGLDTHVQDDMTVDITGAGYVPGVTDFNSGGFIDAVTTMGDSMERITGLMVHSIVYSRMQKNNLIQFIPDARGEINIPTFMGRVVIVDDGVPNPAGIGAAATAPGIFHSWLLGAGAFRWGEGAPKVPVELERLPLSGNGAGQELLINRKEWSLHPVGHAFIGVGTPDGGPSNAATAGNLAHQDSWSRVFPERKQIHLARLLTREFA